jgi:hypothetical protein
VTWITAQKWVITLAQQQVHLTAHVWVNPEKENIAKPECITIGAQWWVNLFTIDQVCKLGMQTVPFLDSTVFCLCKCAFTEVSPIALETIPAYQEVCVAGPQLKNFVVLHQSYLPDYFSQPTSQYPIYDMHGKFINSITVSDDILSDGLFKSFIQHLVQSHAVQLSINILSWCHEMLLVFQENYYMLFCFDLTVHEQCIRVSLMLNRFKYYNHDFKMHISKIMSIETHYNTASFVIYLENIIIQVYSCVKYSQKKFHTLGLIGRSSKTHSMVILPMKQHKV